MQTLLVATDFSSTANSAVSRAARLAAEHHARLILLHNLSGTDLESLRVRLLLGDPESEIRLQQHYTEALQRLAEALSRRWNIEVTPQLTTGQAHREINRVARERGVDLVVVGTVGEHAVRDFFLGSTAERVLRESPVPVLVVRQDVGQKGGQIEENPYVRVFAALDLSVQSPAVIKLAHQIAPAAWLTLGHVFEVPFEGYLQIANASEDKIAYYRQRERARTQTALQALAAALPTTRSVDIRVEQGMPFAVLPRLLQETAADLVVAGKHGASEIVDLFLGSMTKHLLSEVTCDVLVVPPARELKA